jgi:periplasmic protein TonB
LYKELAVANKQKMTDNFNKVPDFDDLLFEKRNKDYGAYQLRKKYKTLVITGTITVIFLATIAVVIPFVLTPDNERALARGTRFVQVTMDNLEPPKEELIVPPATPPPKAERINEIVKYVPPVVVDSIITIEKPIATTDDALTLISEERTEATVTGRGEDLLSGQNGTETDDAFFIVEIMPTFKGGDIDKFRDWVRKRTTYPQLATEKKIQGRVILTFIVETDGSVSSVKVLKGVDPLIDSEAVKTIESSPKWSPGLQRGKPVRVRYSIGLIFVI